MKRKFTKHHATVYHRNIRSRYIGDKMQNLEQSITSNFKSYTSILLQGCVDPDGTEGSVINETDIIIIICDRLAQMTQSDDLSTFRRNF